MSRKHFAIPLPSRTSPAIALVVDPLETERLTGECVPKPPTNNSGKRSPMQKHTLKADQPNPQPGENRIRLPKLGTFSKRKASICGHSRRRRTYRPKFGLTDEGRRYRNRLRIEPSRTEALFAMFIFFSRHRSCAVFPLPRNRDRDVIGEMT